ncbi:alanine--glyoxylate aminotransferase family protein [Pseudoalteromonas sp. SMS1]|uniref:pyridoxal-phosphate-dependent aminotransferase family protein n=1 Tax=Pseudoalteromonas sp. SMS1 TaxID=2908894 RepID=UPI001F1C25FE|nr:alanine--glyoxylate aminotransferase family protein [Pseudoalteromonas sp. SMS1]MCF2858774.1 alanine--glyoxylate aminotransferase family protein [Pseudoalteromonas sp. SMS1]
MLGAFNPIPRVLMGPGPSNVSPRVLGALAKPTVGHLDPQFIQLMDEVKTLLQYAFATENEFTIALSAPGSAGMEACIVNLIEPNDKVIVCINGVFGGRLKENIERVGAQAIVIEDNWGEPVSVEKVAAAFSTHSNIKALVFVHAETSTGVCSDAKALCELAKHYDALTIVDAVTSLGGSELKVDEWGIDAVYSGSQKCLSCVPGLSPVSFSPKAVEAIKMRKTKVQSWFLDQSLVMDYWSGNGKRSYHHTAPINSLYALHEALLMLKNEGRENAWARHNRLHLRLKQGIEQLGIDFLVDEAHRLPQLNSLVIPQGVDDIKTRQYLLDTYNLEIGAGLGKLAGTTWRVGLMGETANEQNIALLLSALTDVIK